MCGKEDIARPVACRRSDRLHEVHSYQRHRFQHDDVLEVNLEFSQSNLLVYRTELASGREASRGSAGRQPDRPTGTTRTDWLDLLGLLDSLSLYLSRFEFYLRGILFQG